MQKIIKLYGVPFFWDPELQNPVKVGENVEDDQFFYFCTKNYVDRKSIEYLFQNFYLDIEPVYVEKPNTVMITQFKYVDDTLIYGLGDDNIMYCWDQKTKNWRIRL